MSNIITWITDNYIEVFGAVAGVIYVFLEIKQNIWLWPVGVVTSAVYIWIFLTGKLYADMSLQVYYLIISIIGWYWWIKGIRRSGSEKNRNAAGVNHAEGAIPTGSGAIISVETPDRELSVTRINRIMVIRLTIVFVMLFFVMWFVLSRLTDSPVPGWDSFITSLSVVATWMLARKIFEHWYLWIIVNITATVLFLSRGLYPTVILYIVYCIMSFEGLREWKKSLTEN